MPYIALQLLGIRAVLTAGGLYPPGPAGDLALVAVFAILAVATYRHGLRAPTVIALVKGAVIFGSVIAVVLLVLARLDGPGALFTAARSRGDDASIPNDVPLALEPQMFPVFATLALGSAMALLMYPHVLTSAFAASSSDTLRRTVIGLPAWTAVLGLFGLLGIAALAAGVQAPTGSAEMAVPLLVRELMPPALTGLVLGALAVGALVPASVMSIAAATSFVRNIYIQYFHPTATPKHQMRIAQAVSVTAKLGAVVFVFGLRNQVAINLQLLGGVWILQTFPAVAIGLYTRWLHHRALLAGWVVGMVGGTLMVVWGGFSSIISINLAGRHVQVYAALAALALNLVVAVALTPLLDWLRSPRSVDHTVLPAPAGSLPAQGTNLT
ncbi:hypothetical protein ABZ807_10825 [Micromonospora sp. NPDC047548]|uniref:sodium:solute symporter family protein n=1 Tax=Micromonospora sp. NPDC047548 TaxID=3155624 RepID=UPI0033FD0CF8